MSNDFYNNSTHTLATGTTAQATDVEAKFDEVVTGFAKLPDEEELNRGSTYFADDTGAANTYAVAMHQTASSYIDGMRVDMRVSVTNTGASTLNVDTIGAKSIKRQNGDAVEAGDLTAGDIVCLIFDDTNDFFILASDASSSAVTRAREWATKTSAKVNATDWSSKAYAINDLTGTDGGSSKDWAVTAEDSVVTGTSYSAYHWAQKSAKGERLTATSSSSVAIGTGTKTFTLNESYRAFIAGSDIKISETADPTTNYMTGVVTSYNSSTNVLVVAVAAVGGSGTISAWSMAPRMTGDADTLEGYTAAQVAALGAGGNASLAQSSDITLTSSDAQVQVISFDDYGYVVNMPDATGLNEGLPFILKNESTVYPYGVKDSTGGVIGQVQPLKTMECLLTDNGTAAGTWSQSGGLDIIVGEPFVFNAVASGDFSAVPISSTVVLVGYQGASDFLNVVALDISGSVATVLDGPDVYNAVASGDIQGVKLSATEAMFVYEDTTNNDGLEAVVADYTTGTLSQTGNATAISANNATYFCPVGLSGTEVLVAFTEAVTVDFRASLVDWTSPNISVTGGPTQMSATIQQYISGAKIDATNALFVTRDSGDNDLNAYTINWAAGGPTISLTDEDTLATGTIRTFGVVSLHTAGGLQYYAALFDDTDSDNDEAHMEFLTVNTSTYEVLAVSEVREINYGQNFIVLSNHPNDGDLFSLDDATVYYHQTESATRTAMLQRLDRVGNTHLFPGAAERVALPFLMEYSVKKVSSTKAVVTGLDNDNSDYGTIIIVEG